MNLFSTLVYLLASSACVAASPPADVNDKNCGQVPDVTKADVDRFLGFQFGLPILCGVTGWPMEAYPDLQRYHNRGPADDDRRREAFDCLLKKLNRDAEEDLRRKWPHHIRPRDAPAETVDPGRSESELSSLTEHTSRKAIESLDDSDETDTDYGFEDWMPVDASDLY